MLAPAVLVLTAVAVTGLPVLLLVAVALADGPARPVAGAAAALDGAAVPAARVGGAGRAVRAVGGQRLRLADPVAAVPAGALRAGAVVPADPVLGVPAGAARAGRGRGAAADVVRREAAADPEPARRPGRLVPRRARAAELVRAGAADRAQGHPAVGPRDRRAAQPAAEPVHPARPGRGRRPGGARRSAS